MPRVKFSNHCLVLFSALFAAELWTHSTTPAEDEPPGIASAAISLCSPHLHLPLSSTFPSPPQHSTHLLTNHTAEQQDGSSGMGKLPVTSHQIFSTFDLGELQAMSWSRFPRDQPLLLYLHQKWLEGHPDAGSHLPQHRPAQQFSEPAFGVRALSLFIGTAVLQVKC